MGIPRFRVGTRLAVPGLVRMAVGMAVGMAVSETAYVPEDMGDVYLDDGEEYDGESWDGETDWDGETGEDGEMDDGETGAIPGDMDLDEFKLDLGRIRSDDGETDGEGEEPTGGAQG